MTTAPLLTTEDLVARLLATDDAGQRHALIERCANERATATFVIHRLLEEAEQLINVDSRRMEQVCLDALALSKQIGDDFLWAMARFKHGEACTLQERNAEARRYLDEAAAVFASLNRPVEAARTRIPWIWAAAKLGGDADALAAARAARRVFVAHNETLRRATLDMNIGTLHYERERYQAALRRFSAALNLFEKLDQPDRVARAHHNIGAALARLGRYKEALRALESARDIGPGPGRDQLDALLSRLIGEVQMSLGRHNDALRSLEDARDRFGALRLHAGAVWLARDLADCYLQLNRPVDAMTTLTCAIEGLNHIDRNADIYAIAVRRAAAHLLLGDEQTALAVLDAVPPEAMSSPGDYAWLTAQRASLLLQEGNAPEALTTARTAVRTARIVGRRRLVADARLIEGAALVELRQYDGARRTIQSARRLARSLNATPLLHRASVVLGRIAEAGGRFAIARRHYAAAIEQIEREQRSVIFEFRDSLASNRNAAYERLAALLLNAGHAEQALVTAERAKSRALADAIAGNVRLRPRGNPTARRLARDLAAAREEYAAAHARLTRGDGVKGSTTGDMDDSNHLVALEARINDLLHRLQLSEANEQMADVYGVASVRLPVVASDTALIEFFFAGEDILRFVVDSSGVRGDVLPAAVPEIERLLRVFRLNLEAAERSIHGAGEGLTAQARAVLHRLNERLLGGLTIDDRCRSLVFVPHGLLHYLPFHALYDGHRYLVERYAVSYAPSATIYGWCLQRRRRVRRGTALVLANSAHGALPSTISEAHKVGGLLEAPVFQEAEATRAVVENYSRRAATIHLAAHGRFRADAPLFSHIQLADGPLTTADVFNLRLRANLVTLSACETGRAVIGGGDELIGLTRAFLYAGAAELLVSQWRVEDGSTAVLMERFYREAARLRQRDGHAAALRAAQIAFLRPTDPFGSARDHPFYWAGFQVIGAG